MVHPTYWSEIFYHIIFQGKHMDSQFDNIFGEGPTPTPSMLAPFEDEQVSSL